MKRSFFLPLLCTLTLVLLLLSLTGCDSPWEEKPIYTVTLYPLNGEDPSTVQVEEGRALVHPGRPSKEGYLFDAWYLDPALTQPYRFGLAVTEDLTLYAGYYIDYAYLTNRVTQEAVPATVTVRAGSWGTAKSGSGVIFHREGNRYYVLTNTHVVTTGSSATYSVEDCYGNSYTATPVGKDGSYDLALLYFTTAESLPTLSLATSDPGAGEAVIALGQPLGQSNAVTYGVVESYTAVSVSSSSASVTFPVIRHTAPIDSGSSGGALLDTSLRIVGINFADGTDDDGRFVCGFAVSVEKIREFLGSLGY